MEVTKISEELEYNVSKVLVMVENNKDLDEMFRTEFATEYKMCHSLINSGTGLNAKGEKFLKGIFNSVILESKAFRETYASLDDKVDSEPVNEIVEKKDSKPNMKKRWGLKAIADDIAQHFGGEEKQIHKTANKVQNLKKIFTRLEMRMYNERFTKETLTDEQLREIGGAIDTFNKKVESIINPKK